MTYNHEEIRSRAHIANGGESDGVECPKCRGTGKWRGNYRVFPCRACDGTGKTTARKAGAHKAQITKRNNAALWLEEHKAEVDFINAEIAYADKKGGGGATFYRDMLAGIDSFGKLTDNQLAAVRRGIEKKAERLQEWKAKQNAGAPTLSGSIGVERINALFAAALASGLKKPMFRAGDLIIKPAKKDSSILYVTDKRVPDPYYGGAGYVGKIVNGKFEARREAKPDTLGILCELAENPMETAVKYGRATGNCCMCGRQLTDPASVDAGIGPICAENWGI